MKKSVRNIAFAMVGYVVTLGLQLLNRLVFVRFLSVEYLGINGLFSNILSVLALSELGVGSAIVFALYKPVAEHDVEKIKSIMHLYRRLYTGIGCMILLTGALLTPFLQLFIKDMPDIPLLRVYYLLYVLNSGISYFYTYKRSLIICNQEEYISTVTTMAASIGTRLIQILVLLLTQNYLLFLLVQLLFTRAENVVIARIADQKYPFLKEKDSKPLAKADTDGIRKNVLAMMVHKVGEVAVNSTDNLIVSKILGLASVGLLSNYTLIVETISGLVIRVFSAITASLGNLTVTESQEKSEKIFYHILFGNFWLVSFFSIGMYCLIQPFIILWVGEEYLLSSGLVWALLGCFYLSGMRRTALQFRTAAGLFWQDRYKAILESAVNLAVSIPLTIHMGVTGVKLGTCISTLTTSFWIEGWILFRFYFKKSAAVYFRRQLFYMLLTLAVGLTAAWLCGSIPGHSLLSLCGRAVVCTGFVNGCYVVLFARSQEFVYYKNLIRSRLGKRAGQ